MFWNARRCLSVNFEAVFSNCSNNHLKKPGGTFLDFFSILLLLLFYLKRFGSTDNRDQR